MRAVALMKKLVLQVSGDLSETTSEKEEERRFNHRGQAVALPLNRQTKTRRGKRETERHNESRKLESERSLLRAWMVTEPVLPF